MIERPKRPLYAAKWYNYCQRLVAFALFQPLPASPKDREKQNSTERYVFGSRLTDKIKPYSDLDLAIVGKNKIDRLVLIRLKEDFEASDLPFRVDLLDWHRISPEFRAVIEKNYLTLR